MRQGFKGDRQTLKYHIVAAWSIKKKPQDFLRVWISWAKKVGERKQ